MQAAIPSGPTPQGGKVLARRRRPRWGTLLLVVVGHILALAGLVRAFAPELTAAALDRAEALVTISVTPPPAPRPTAPPAPRAEAEPAPEAPPAPTATPPEVTAPPAPLPRRTAAPRAASTGRANQAGAATAGAGTGAGGEGTGLGGGGSGAGSGGGGGAVTKPEKIAGDIRSAADYPAPPGGRQARFGQSVTIAMSVGTDGRASNCRVLRPSNDPVADRITCELAVERFRFRPATDAEGNSVAATYGWRQDFFQTR